MSAELAAAISRAKGVKQSGIRVGHWLTKEEASQLLALPDLATTKGVRDRAVLALLIGAGLRRSELAGLNCLRTEFQLPISTHCRLRMY